MSGGQEKNFSTLGPKLRGNKAQQDYGDKQRQICIEVIDYLALSLVVNLQGVLKPYLGLDLIDPSLVTFKVAHIISYQMS